MNPDYAPRSAGRARWLAELADALDEARVLLSQLIAERIELADADRLRARVEELRLELHALHKSGFGSGRLVDRFRPIHPDWRSRRD